MAHIIFFSDTHLGIDMPVKPKKNRRRRGADYFDKFQFVLDYAVERKADLIIHGGDLFDKPNTHQSIVDLAYAKLFDVAEKGIPIIICPGNHERSALPPSLYLSHSNIFVYREAQVFPFNFNGQVLQIAGFPYRRRNVKEDFPIICSQLEQKLNSFNSVKLLLMHQAIEGAVAGPQKFMFRKGQDVVQITDIPSDYDLILSGHIHPTQQLKTNQGKTILYAGSTERTAFAEKDEEKGFYEIDIDVDKSIKLQFISLKTRPMEILRLNAEFYNVDSIKNEIRNAIKNYPNDAVVQIRVANQDNLKLLKVGLLDEIFPKTMNYSVSGYRRLV